MCYKKETRIIGSRAGVSPMGVKGQDQFNSAAIVATPPLFQNPGQRLWPVHADEHMSLAYMELEAGHAISLHYHQTFSELYIFEDGSGKLQVGELRYDTMMGMSIPIPVGQPHQLVNDGPETISFWIVCAPPYNPEDYEAIAPGW